MHTFTVLLAFLAAALLHAQTNNPEPALSPSSSSNRIISTLQQYRTQLQDNEKVKTTRIEQLEVQSMALRSTSKSTTDQMMTMDRQLKEAKAERAAIREQIYDDLHAIQKLSMPGISRLTKHGLHVEVFGISGLDATAVFQAAESVRPMVRLMLEDLNQISSTGPSPPFTDYFHVKDLKTIRRVLDAVEKKQNLVVLMGRGGRKRRKEGRLAANHDALYVTVQKDFFRETPLVQIRVMLHEMTHYFNRIDVAFEGAVRADCYGPQSCKLLNQVDQRGGTIKLPEGLVRATGGPANVSHLICLFYLSF
jgi:hypothetical protein